MKKTLIALFLISALLISLTAGAYADTVEPIVPEALRNLVAGKTFTAFIDGFASDEERRLFRLLIEVSGIGGKLALNVLSSTSVPAFCAAVAASDVKSLSRINGIGKRTAERIVVELRDKLNSGLGGEVAVAAAAPETASAINDVALALEQLGFKRDAIDKTLKSLVAELPEEGIDGEKLLRNAIRKLSF